MKILHLKLLRRMQVFQRYLKSTKQSSRIGYFRFSWIKSVETGMYFDSSIPQGYGVGSSGSSSYIWQICPRQNYCSREFNSWKVIAAKNIFSQMEAFSRKSSGLDPLNSYLSIPILINSKIILKLQVFQIKLWTEKALCFVRFRIVGETAMVTIFMENLKAKLPYDAESVRKIYWCLCGKFPRWRYESLVYEY
jgi:mevalonate kinase